VFGFVIDRMGVLFLGGGRGGLLIGSDLDEFGVSFWDSGSQFEDGLNVVVPRWKGGGWCVYLGSGWKV